jgi:hypothetical protein
VQTRLPIFCSTQLATTLSQELNTLIVDNLQNKKDIKTLKSNISSLYSFVQNLQDQCGHIKYIKDTLNQMMGHSLNPTSTEKPSYQEDNDSSHYQGPHSTHLPRYLRLPIIEVNKFDGSNPTIWVTQMEHYLSLHGITDDLSNLLLWYPKYGSGMLTMVEMA